MKKQKADYIVQSVDRALDILEAFNYNEEELGVTELSHKLKLHKNNVFRLLATLECRGYIEQDKTTGNYRLGIKTFEVAHVFMHHLGLRKQARPVLEEIVQKSNETAYLALLDGAETVYVLMSETHHTVRVIPRLGFRLPAHCTALGKAQLAYESLDQLERLFKGRLMTKYTENTIVDYEQLLNHLREAAQSGLAIDNEEFELGVKCVAAPVRDYTHRVVAAVGISGPTNRLSPERIEKELAAIVKEAGINISRRLGYEVGIPPE